MAEPKVAETQPELVELEAGKNYAWCSCGESSNQPFCDGSHKGSDFSPEVFQVEETKTYALCACKHTGNPVFCDGSHTSFS